MFTSTFPPTTLGTLGDASAALVGVPLQSGSLLGLAIVFFALALAAAVVGARGIAGMNMEIARILVLVFLVLAILSLLL
ncbi:DUF1328 family protein [Haloarchaeobius iranensis]|uniref:UPF0391 membrane protein SAMN05192554_12058 n=1 Tax=Haloarchaeobius iranensis TaxID=996166 RepID=A0A1G9ZIQ6_9EURY|nr:DUF1328 family protein [Haloarchaeobius iranensis]SDN20891.1 Protein of unknown function [Haloarchaeobius iranensis]